MKPGQPRLILLSILLFSFSTITFAQHGHDHGHAGKKQPVKASKHVSSKNKLHMFSPVWMHTLSDEQKVAIDKMHLEVAKVEKLLRAQMKATKMELNLLAVTDSPDMDAINKKIDEVAALKTKIMRNRFAHIVEMREALTPQQRVSYDMSVLKRDERKKGGKGH